ncbi:hypothetical protein [Deinococcus cellulosilyticus]|uniref:Uncharacterized protein n=1 Tax=Deinococcus cellulosilyticus (strain DSM 18568 / NBRC 106333 / KACC 11606 / 5516J-15) TaxID=1223518 RepID=A0A511N6F8_DEIC1|nr:hypothetical protein [Deinococcus cellulosilyticus]GEM48462.1 hypothetical protein DC3_40970 [Deinococcus cellulosilyticus NBRC 106333 = KACC 11606]
MKKLLLCATLLLGLAVAQDHSGMDHSSMGQAPGMPTFTDEQKAEMAKVARRWGLPEDTVKVSDCVPTMGEHWVRLQDFPLGPIYGFMNGKMVFVEIMPSQADFAAGKSWLETLKTPKGYLKIDHVDFEFQPMGHEGYPIPHYDIHAYFVPHEEHMQYCLPPQ